MNESLGSEVSYKVSCEVWSKPVFHTASRFILSAYL